MPGDLVLVIDAGTSALRSVLVDVAGGRTIERLAGAERGPALSIASVEWPAAELDETWICARMGELLTVPPEFRPHVAAVAFTGQREGLVIADAANRPVLISPNTDTRASAEGAAIDAAHGADVYDTTGHLPSLLLAPAKYAWARKHLVAPGPFTVTPLVDWLAASAAGEVPRMTRSLAAEIGVLDVATGDVAGALLASLGCDAALPTLVCDGAVIGAQGDLAGVPVIAAGADTQCALVGMDAMKAGDCGVPAGWSAPVHLVTDRAIIDPERRTWTGLHVVPRPSILESNAGDTGRAWSWICSMLQLPPADAANIAAQAPVGSDDVLSVVGTRVMRASQMTAGLGALTFPLPMTAFSSDRPRLLRSVLESVAFAIRSNLEQLEAVSGAPIEALRLGGGMSAAPAFARIVADVVGRPLSVARSPQTTALGAAVLAAAAVGLHPDVVSAVGTIAGDLCVIEPSARDAAAYDDVYSRWQTMCDGLERIAMES